MPAPAFIELAQNNTEVSVNVIMKDRPMYPPTYYLDNPNAP
jgi:hypothetical protein